MRQPVLETEPRRHGDTEGGGLRTSPRPAWPAANSADVLLLECTGVWPAPVLPGFHRSPPLGSVIGLAIGFVIVVLRTGVSTTMRITRPTTGARPSLLFHGELAPQPPCSGSVPPWFRRRKMTPPGDRRRQPCGRCVFLSSNCPFVPDTPGAPSSCGMAVDGSY